MMKKTAQSSKQFFRPIRLGRGEQIIGPMRPPTGKIEPIHENSSAVGTKSRGESTRSLVILAIAGDDHPMVVPQDIPTKFAVVIKM